MKTFVAVYFDLENIDPKLNIKNLLNEISRSFEDSTSVFVIKYACGDSTSIGKFREQLKNQNFDIRETPHIGNGNMKNRADLILSLDAFETLYQPNLKIDSYVFITSDTDFTVIMDKLRKYGKKVVLVSKKSEQTRELFNCCSDKIFALEDFCEHSPCENEVTINKEKEQEPLESYLKKFGFSKDEIKGIKNTLQKLEKNKWINSGIFGQTLRKEVKNFSYKGKKLNSQQKLLLQLKNLKFLDLKKEKKHDFFKIPNIG